WEAGFELRALKNRLYFEAVYYDKTTKDVITVVPGLAGQVPGLGNLGEVANKGFEFSASYSQSLTRDLNFTISGNLTTMKNRVLQLNKAGYEIFNGPARTTVGYPIGYFYGYQVEGVYQTATEILKSVPNTLYAVK